MTGADLLLGLLACLASVAGSLVLGALWERCARTRCTRCGRRSFAALCDGCWSATTRGGS